MRICNKIALSLQLSTNKKPAFTSEIIVSKNAKKILKRGIDKKYYNIPVQVLKGVDKNFKPISFKDYKKNLIADFIDKFKQNTDEKKLGGTFRLFKGKNESLLVKYSDAAKKLKAKANLKSLNLITTRTIIQKPFWGQPFGSCEVRYFDSAIKRIFTEIANSFAKQGKKEHPLKSFEKANSIDSLLNEIEKIKQKIAKRNEY